MPDRKIRFGFWLAAGNLWSSVLGGCAATPAARRTEMAMARWFEPTEEQAAAWSGWVARQHEAAQSLLGDIAPWELYWQPSTGLIVTFRGLKTEAHETFTVFVNLIGHVQHDFSSPYYGAPVADPSEIKAYEPISRDELIVLAYRASGDPTGGACLAPDSGRGGTH
ncbi:hypothetical protein Y590_23105 [Methylobacterium sp. AMS5]|nr:hypothetical protein Y590_23105 [Methylobacterium sp. AMS5]